MTSHVEKYGRFNSRIHMAALHSHSGAVAVVAGACIAAVGSLLGGNPVPALLTGVAVMVVTYAVVYRAIMQEGSRDLWLVDTFAPMLMRGGEIGVEATARELRNSRGETAWQPELARPYDGEAMLLWCDRGWVLEMTGPRTDDDPVAMTAEKAARVALRRYRIEIARRWVIERHREAEARHEDHRFYDASELDAVTDTAD